MDIKMDGLEPRSGSVIARRSRSATDEAFIMLIGRRFGERLYQLGLPSFWREELVTSDDPVAEVAAFWKARDGASGSGFGPAT